ncbi:MAG: 16S rRNA (guanine(966)-N(2))-methyltransferase RsmD [Nitrospirales bacterium]
MLQATRVPSQRRPVRTPEVRVRVIAGSHKGRRLLGPKGHTLRPTPDRVKAALFSILGDRILDARVLDLFAGTGAIGIEALSRGASAVTFVEPDTESLRLLRANLTRCQLEEAADLQACTAEAFLRHSRAGGTFDIAFADPPYALDSGAHLLPSLSRAGILTSDSVVVLEHATRQPPPDEVGRLIRHRQYRYGDTTLSLYHVRNEGDPSS